MKYSYLLCLLFLFPLFTKSQIKAIAPEDAIFETVFKNAKTVPIVKGKLLNISAEEIANMSIDYAMVTPFAETQVKKTTKLSKDGSFQLTIDYAFPYQQIFLSVGNNDLFYTSLIVNNGLLIELDMKKIKAQKELNFNGDGVKFLGADGPVTTYFNNHILYKRKEQLELSSKLNKLSSFDKSHSDTDFFNQYDELYKAIAAIDESYISENPSPYSWLIENERLSDYYAEICVRNWNKTMDAGLWDKIKSHKVYMVTNNSMFFYNYLVNYIRFMPMNKVVVSSTEVYSMPDLTTEELAIVDSLKKNTSVINDPAEYRRISRKLQPRFSKLMTEKYSTRLIYCLDSIFPSPKADFIKLHIGSKDPEEQKVLFEKALASMKTDWTKKVLTAEYKKTVDKIASINKSLSQSVALTKGSMLGEPLLETPFGARLFKVSNMKAADFLARLKQTYAGKALVLDFWATWCGPCLSEMPYGKKLHDQTKDLPVNFIYLCTANGSDEKKWKAKVIELKQPGTHFFLDEELVNELMGLFSFSGYPSYGFINRKGVYKPGAIKWMSAIDSNTLTALIKEE